ncbi:hypothetical protein [Thalassobacillus sp. CUG 92003]|uniref:hypothetical protein n=1 Tax=Thalassobacillus sp. CUG 92003 TaxID=2736641 RepID=UPI0015E6567F|nr:hypothetical protein [Thalassobacillus sp. CUG 92003]
MNVIDLIQTEVDRITSEKYKRDECPPVFTVSVLYEMNTHKIVLTARHLGTTVSEPLFPNFEMKYGYDSIESEMESLYNRTM